MEFEFLKKPYRIEEMDYLAILFLRKNTKYADENVTNLTTPYRAADYFKMIFEIALRKLSRVSLEDTDKIKDFQKFFGSDETQRQFPLGQLKPARIIKVLHHQRSTIYEIRIDMSDYEHHRILFFCNKNHVQPDNILMTYGFTKNNQNIDQTDVLAESSCCIKEHLQQNNYNEKIWQEWTSI